MTVEVERLPESLFWSDCRQLFRDAKKAGKKGRYGDLKTAARALGEIVYAKRPRGDYFFPSFDEQCERVIASATPADADEAKRAKIRATIEDHFFRGEQDHRRIVLMTEDERGDAPAARLEDRANRLAEEMMARQRAQEIVAAEKAGTDDEGPDYADVAAIIANGVERRDTDAGGVRNDGVRLGYRGKTHSLLGPPESGKTLVAIAQACDELRIGGAS